MLFIKILLRNTRRSVKDYLVYMVTLALCAALFYAFLSITSRYYQPDIGAEFDISVLGDGMKLTVCMITLLLLFLIRYVNRFMLLRRQKEFGLQTVMGLELSVTARLFFGEIFLMGMAAVAAGIFLGTLLSQFITAMLMNTYGKSYEITMTLFPDTVVLTLAFFAAAFLGMSFVQMRSIRKMKPIDMLYEDRKNEGSFKKSRWHRAAVALYLVSCLWMASKGIRNLYFYYDSRHPLPVRVMYWGNLLVPGLLFLCSVLFLAAKRKLSEGLLGFLLAGSVIAAVFASQIPSMNMKYYLNMGRGMENQYMMFVLFDLVFAVSILFFFLSSLLTGLKNRYPKLKYHQENLFFFGQILSKLKTSYKTMTLTCLTLMFAIGLFVIEPLLSGWAMGYLKMRVPYDIQMFSNYPKTRTIEELSAELSQVDYTFLETLLEEKGITEYDSCFFYTSFPQKSDFDRRIKYDFPVTAMSLSDFNRLLNMRGTKPVQLQEGTFAVQWAARTEESTIREFTEEHQTLATDGGVLTLAEDGILREELGEYIYNSYVDALYIVPDAVFEKLIPCSVNGMIKTKEPIAYAAARELEVCFLERFSEDAGEGLRCGIRLSTVETNEVLWSMFILRAGLTYAAVVLFVICFTILSLQQLFEAGAYQRRFLLLYKLGVERKRRSRLILMQMGIWFGLPVLTALLGVLAFVWYLFQTYASEIRAYIGFAELAGQIGVTLAVLAVLLLCYFVSTWLLFKRSVERGISREN